MDRGRLQVVGFDPEQTEVAQQQKEESAEVTVEDLETTSRWKRGWQQFKRNRAALISVAIVGFMIFLAIFSRPWIYLGETAIPPRYLAPYSASEYLFDNPDAPCYPDCTYQAPMSGHWFGTDGQGRDLFSRVIYGGRFSLSIGFIVVFLTASVGLVYGAVSGYFGGWVDEILMRIVDVIYAFPGLILALVIVAIFGGGYWQLVAAFSLFGWASYGRLVRGEVLKIKEMEYVMAAKALGSSDRSVIFKHIIPNAMPPLIVLATLNIGTVVIGVAALGFLGLGLDGTSAEWGTMLDQTRDTLIQPDVSDIPWWATVFPGAAIFTFVMAMNMIGDGVNDALDTDQTGVGRGGGG